MKNLTIRFAVFIILLTLLSSCINNSDSGSSTQDKKDPNPPPPPPSNVSDKALNVAVKNLTLNENSTAELNITLDHSQLGSDTVVVGFVKTIFDLILRYKNLYLKTVILNYEALLIY